MQLLMAHTIKDGQQKLTAAKDELHKRFEDKIEELTKRHKEETQSLNELIKDKLAKISKM